LELQVVQAQYEARLQALMTFEQPDWQESPLAAARAPLLESEPLARQLSGWKAAQLSLECLTALPGQALRALPQMASLGAAAEAEALVARAARPVEKPAAAFQ
jgi:hypothetical protein